MIRAAELMGVQIPRFCDHPLLDPVGACRQCLVEVEGQRKPMASCTITVHRPTWWCAPSTRPEAADKAQHGVMELLLINHPLDCPVCDKGGECPLQNQAMSNGRADTRFDRRQAHVPQADQHLLARCCWTASAACCARAAPGSPTRSPATRSSSCWNAAPCNRSASRPDEPFDSYFSGNTVQICPVGALTGAAYRFRARPFDLVSSPSVCEHCASGCAQRTDHRRGKVLRRLAGDDPEVNEEWNCDKGRWAFTYATQGDRITTPLVRDDDGKLRPASWSEAIAVAVAGPDRRGRQRRCAGRRPGDPARTPTPTPSSPESCWAPTTSTSAPARTATRRRSSWPAGWRAEPMAVTYADLESAPAVLLAGFEPEEESPDRLPAAAQGRPQARAAGARRRAVRHPRADQDGRHGWSRPRPAREAAALDGWPRRRDLPHPGRSSWSANGWPPAPVRISAAARLADATGARLAWVPRRAGERGALEAGCAAQPAARRPARRRRRRPRAGRRRRGMSTSCPPPGPRHRRQSWPRPPTVELGALLIGGVELGRPARPRRGAGRASTPRRSS